MSLRKFAENHGKKIKIIFVLIDLKRENKEDVVFVEKRIKNQHIKRRLFENI